MRKNDLKAKSLRVCGAQLEYNYCLYTDKSVHHYADDAAATVSHNPLWCRCVIPHTEEAKQ